MTTREKFTIEEARDVTDRLGIDYAHGPFDLEQFRMGFDVELEHGTHDPETDVTGDDPIITGKIALAHLRELPDYYTRLAVMDGGGRAMTTSSTIDRVAELLRPDVLAESCEPYVRKVVLASGIVASVVYVAANVFAALAYDGYSTVNQAVSELSAIDAPSRPLMVTFLLVFGVLSLAFAIGVVWASGRNRPLRVTGWALVVVGVVNMVAVLFPMHMREVVAAGGDTWTDTAHKIVTAVNVVPFVVAMGFSAWAFGKRFRLYSLATLAAVTVFGIVAGSQGGGIAANEPTPWHGVYERINIGGYLLWMAVLAIVLLRKQAKHLKEVER